MIKIAMIGAGSVVFSRNLTGDILSYPEFANATISYMDIDAERLEVGSRLCRKAADAMGVKPTIEATRDRREALRDADFVINMVQIGGFNSTLVDFEIPRKYGLNFTIADTTGPGGLFRALRTFPMLSGLARDMAEVCPKATLLNYSNPMSMNMQSITRTSEIAAVGLCHSVQGTFDELMRYIGEDPHQVAFTCAGINHMAFYLKIEKDGVDLYPRLFDALNRPEAYNTNKVRFELMRRLGHFVTESSEHNAEYSAHFMSHGPATIAKFNVPIDEYLRRCDGIIDEYDRMRKFAMSDEAGKPPHRSREYGSTIINSMVTGTPSVVYGNMPNRGAIANLPPGAIVEAPTLVDRAGLRAIRVGELPPQLVAYMNPHVSQHELFIRAALEGRRDHVYQAAMFDPLTAATMPLDKIVEMCDELIAGHGFEKDGGYLPNLDAKKTLVTQFGASGRSFDVPSREALRKSWDDAAALAGEPFVLDWHLIGAFRGDEKINLNFATALEADFAKRGDGAVDLGATYSDPALKGDGPKLSWKPVKARRRNGLVNCANEVGQIEYCVAYGYFELKCVHARETVLRCGSDDGVKIWLNGEVVHANDAMRGYSANIDEAPIALKAGVNRFLFKVVNYKAGWGFGASIPTATS